MLKGFTLLELMVVLFILAITVSVGVPAYALLTAGSALVDNAYALKQDAVLARSDAETSGSSVVLCPYSSTAGTCGTSWSAGWVILPANNLCAPTGAIALKVQKAINSTVSNTLSSVCFNRFGMLNSAVQWELQSSSHSLCVSDNATGHVVVQECSS